MKTAQLGKAPTDPGPRIIHTIRVLETVAARAAVRKTERADNMATYSEYVGKVR